MITQDTLDFFKVTACYSIFFSLIGKDFYEGSVSTFFDWLKDILRLPFGLSVGTLVLCSSFDTYGSSMTGDLVISLVARFVLEITLSFSLV